VHPVIGVMSRGNSPSELGRSVPKRWWHNDFRGSSTVQCSLSNPFRQQAWTGDVGSDLEGVVVKALSAL
jgi:hypothetical protein